MSGRYQPGDGAVPQNQLCDVKLNPLKVGQPVADHYPIVPTNYSCGFSRDGRMIGSNLPVPYPRENPYYHDIPFRRLVEWFSTTNVGEYETSSWQCLGKKERHRLGGYVDGCEHCRFSDMRAPMKSTADKKGCGRHLDGKVQGCLRKINEAEDVNKKPKCKHDEETKEGEDGEGKKAESASIVCSCRVPYPSRYLVQDDPEYKAWVDSKVEAQQKRDRAQHEMLKVPWELKLEKGHYAPPLQATTNEGYGLHLDMLPKYPLKYPQVAFDYNPAKVLVRYTRSNMSDHPPIPDHAFAVDTSELMSQTGENIQGFIGAPYKPDQGGVGDAMKHQTQGDLCLPNAYKEGDEKKLPTITHEGTQATVVAGKGVKPQGHGMPPHDPWTFRRSVVSLGRVVGERPPGYTMAFFTPTGLELNRPIHRNVRMAVGYPDGDKPVESVQVPKSNPGGIYDTHASKLSNTFQKSLCAPKSETFTGFRHDEPCHRDFVNPGYLPAPSYMRGDRTCIPASQRLPCINNVPRKF